MPKYPQVDLPCTALLCRYNEIATKGRNRRMFEDRLLRAVLRVLRRVGGLRTIREPGRLFLLPPVGAEIFTPENLAEMRRRLPRVAGLSSASPGFLVEPNLEAIQKAVDESFDTVCNAAKEVYSEEQLTYRMRVNRNDKDFPMTGTEMEIYFAEHLLPNHPELRVDLKKAILRAEVDIRHSRAFVCYERIAGPGGLPSGSGGRVMALLSGGIDSPVACYEMMRRGCLADFVTFHSEPYTPPALLRKVAALADILNDYQIPGMLFAVNLLEAQKVIRDECRSRFRTLLYRRFMVRIANALADCTKAKALVTGDNIGQVASQTLENLAVVSDASQRMILRPLLTADKQDTVAVAERIGTMAESRESVPDSCTVFAPKDPATAATIDRLEAEEKKLDVEALVEAALDATTVINLDTLEQRPFRRD